MHSADVLLRSAGTALPGPPIDNAALARRFGMSSTWEQWVDAFVGTRSRHLAVDLETAEVRYSLADLGETAARRALAAAGLGTEAVDVVVLGTSTPDQLMPTTVNVIADRLALNDLPTYQLQSGCTGAVQALDVACRLLAGGGHRTALVIGGDVCAKHYDMSVNPAELPPAQQINGLLFGDGAGAAVLSTDPGTGAPGTTGTAAVRDVRVRFTGMNRPPGQTVEWFGAADRGSDRPGAVEDYKAIEESVPAMAADTLEEMLADLDWKRDDLAFLLPPQLSGRMTARIAERLAVPGAQEVTCVADTGNTGNALPFFQLERALPRMVRGDRALALAVESSKWINAGLALEAV
ncbi:3-oxoacyl-ACP synthase III family protein [Actinomadura opuntiae]|uniref:3-oxoacyl-ACP synthase III family protein n=1 Tax=Actinomadura sp. OS1-43 TaxID=604315 RepID=UPI00255B17E7|nr:3-oxoacyl-ACP synthase III family protein [Actinomadura sp. OS1-43]MDL4815432.1 3-oxoacyl-ACP synthase III family protein [Actinomadura sp. OS1-43]